MAGKTSIENGKKGGRPRSNNTLTAEVMRERIADMIAPHLEELVRTLVKKAKKGDIRAVKELFDRAWGRPIQAISTDLKDTIPTLLNSLNMDREKYR